MNHQVPPNLYSEKKECCGCAACYAICPRQAIIMKADDIGFFYPHIMPEKCIKCYQCVKVCPMK